MTLTLAASPVPVPPLIAAVLQQQHLDQYRGPRTLGGADNGWMFPGRAPGTHLHRQTLTEKMHQHGIPIRAARNRAMQHLVTAAPPPVVADLLGYSASTVFRHHEQAAGRYNRYAATAAGIL